MVYLFSVQCALHVVCFLKIILQVVQLSQKPRQHYGQMDGIIYRLKSSWIQIGHWWRMVIVIYLLILIYYTGSEINFFTLAPTGDWTKIFSCQMAISGRQNFFDLSPCTKRQNTCCASVFLAIFMLSPTLKRKLLLSNSYPQFQLFNRINSMPTNFYILWLIFSWYLLTDISSFNTVFP